MNITANDVYALRDATGAGVMDCKEALIESGGDRERALDILRVKGIAKLQKKEHRLAARRPYGEHILYKADGSITDAIFYSDGETRITTTIPNSINGAAAQSHKEEA